MTDEERWADTKGEIIIIGYNNDPIQTVNFVWQKITINSLKQTRNELRKLWWK